MASNNEKILKPLKDICGKIETEKDCTEHIANLRKLTKKAAFYAYHAFIEFLEIFSRNQKIPAANTKTILNLLESILREGSDDKDPFLSRLYNFLVKTKDRTDHIDGFVTICNFETEPKTSKPEVLFLISEILLRFSQNSGQRKILYRNFEVHLTNHSSNPQSFLKLLQSFNRCVQNLGKDSKWAVAEDLMKSSFLKVSKLNLQNESEIKEILNIFSFFLKFGHEKKSLMKVCGEIARNFSKINTEKDGKRCFEILDMTFKMCCEGFSDKNLKDLYSNHFKNTKSLDPSLLFQKTTSIIAKVFGLLINNFEMTSECFTTYHYLAVSFFHVFKEIKKEEGQILCCSDIKRHEAHSVMSSIFNFALNLLSKDKFNAVAAKYLVYHVSYDTQICSELKCKSKAKETLNTYNRCYNVLYDLNTKKNLIPEIIQRIHDVIKALFKLRDSLPEDEKSSTPEPDVLALKMYEIANDKEIAANGIASLMKVYYNSEKFSGKDGKKMLLKYIMALREITGNLGFETAFDFRKSKKFNDGSFDTKGRVIPLDEFLQLEILAISRYNPGEKIEIFGKLFSELLSSSSNLKLVAESCQFVTEQVLKVIDIELFKSKMKELEKESRNFDLEVSLAQAINNYYIFNYCHERTTNSLREDDKKEVMEKLDLKTELGHIRYLNESLRHFSDVVRHLDDFKQDLDKILSIKRVTTILNNMAVQYYVRGIKYKDIEAFTLLWHLSSVEDNPQVLLNTGTFFLDNHELLTDSSGNYVKVSKKMKPLTIDEITAKLNKLVENSMKNFASLPEPTQCYIFSYLLSLWVYLLSTGRLTDGTKIFQKFKTLWDGMKIPAGLANFETIRSKIYFCLVEINMNCYNRPAENFLSFASQILMSIKTIDREFSYQFYQIYHRISFKAINYSLNRLSDMNHYDVTIASLLLMASRKGYCLKVLELLSLSILRSLNMEKIDYAKTQLKEITKVLGLKEEILIETPSKFETPVSMFDYELQGVRKAPTEPESPIICELSMIHEDHSQEMYRQLQSFIHDTSCNCEICSIPQLKFTMFQIGCHYSRLLWMINKRDISMKFNDFAFEPWQIVCDKLRRMKDCEFLMINKSDFAVFSIRWLMQAADTLITLGNFEEVHEIYKEIELICVKGVPDYECFKEALHCRKENLEYLLEHGSPDLDVTENSLDLKYEDFIRSRSDKMIQKKTSNSPGKLKRAFTAPCAPVKKNDVVRVRLVPKPTVTSDAIYIDSDDSTTKPIRKVKKLSSKTTMSDAKSTKLQPSSSVIDLTTETPPATRVRPTRRRMM